MSFWKIAWRSSFDRKAASKPGPAYSWTWPCSRFGCMSKKMTSPSLKPLRPTPHWSISARAFASVSSVDGKVPLSWV